MPEPLPMETAMPVLLMSPKRMLCEKPGGMRGIPVLLPGATVNWSMPALEGPKIWKRLSLASKKVWLQDEMLKSPPEL